MGSSETMEVRAVGSDALPLTRLPKETRRMLTRPPNGATMRVNSKLSCADRMAASAVWTPQQHAGSVRADPEAHRLQTAPGSDERCGRLAYLPTPKRQRLSHVARSPVATGFHMDAGRRQRANRPCGQFGHPGNGFRSGSR